MLLSKINRNNESGHQMQFLGSFRHSYKNKTSVCMVHVSTSHETGRNEAEISVHCKMQTYELA